MDKFVFQLEENKEEFDYNFLKRFEEEMDNNFTEEEREYFFRWIVSRVKEFLPADDVTYASLCGEAADLSCALLDSLGFYNRQVNLRKLFHEILNVHAITIVNFDNDFYIIDPTFRQYLVKEYCIPGKVIPYSDGTVYHVPCYPGYFLNLTEEGRKFGQELLNKGFFKITDQNIKLYCDSFVSYFNSVWQRKDDSNFKSALEYRNGIFKLDSEKCDSVDDGIKLTPSKILEIKKIK